MGPIQNFSALQALLARLLLGGVVGVRYPGRSVPGTPRGGVKPLPLAQEILNLRKFTASVEAFHAKVGEAEISLNDKRRPDLLRRFADLNGVLAMVEALKISSKLRRAEPEKAKELAIALEECAYECAHAAESALYLATYSQKEEDDAWAKKLAGKPKKTRGKSVDAMKALTRLMAEDLKKARKHAGYSKAVLANKVGKPPKYVGDAEQGKVSASQAYRVSVFHACGLPKHWGG